MYEMLRCLYLPPEEAETADAMIQAYACTMSRFFSLGMVASSIPLPGPAGAFAQEYTVMRNTLSDNKLYSHEKTSQYHIYDLIVL